MASSLTIFETHTVDFKILAEEGYDIADLFEGAGWLPFFEAIDCRWHEESVREFWNTVEEFDVNNKVFLKAQVQGQEITVNTSILEEVLGVKAQGAKFNDTWEDDHGSGGRFNMLMYWETGMQDIAKVLFRILQCCVIPSTGDNHISKMERFCVINLLMKQKINLPWIILLGMLRKGKKYAEFLPHNTLIMKLLQYHRVHIEHLYDHRRPCIFKVNGHNSSLNDALQRRPTTEDFEVKRLKIENTMLCKELERTKTALLKLQEAVGVEEQKDERS